MQVAVGDAVDVDCYVETGIDVVVGVDIYGAAYVDADCYIDDRAVVSAHYYCGVDCDVDAGVGCYPAGVDNGDAYGYDGGYVDCGVACYRHDGGDVDVGYGVDRDVVYVVGVGVDIAVYVYDHCDVGVDGYVDVDVAVVHVVYIREGVAGYWYVDAGVDRVVADDGDGYVDVDADVCVYEYIDYDYCCYVNADVMLVSMFILMPTLIVMLMRVLMCMPIVILGVYIDCDAADTCYDDIDRYCAVDIAVHIADYGGRDDDADGCVDADVDVDVDIDG